MTTRTALATATAVLVSGGIAAATNGSDGTINACVGRDGDVRIARKATDCTRKETALTWNQKGPAGPKGETGAKGPVGPAGPKGIEGPAGPAGAAGAAGPAGESGPAGAKGDVGPAGPAGAAGPKGDTGAPGEAGPKGETGAPGEAGPKGENGAAGAAGPAGPAGPKGDAGPAGAKGEKGDPGSSVRSYSVGTGETVRVPLLGGSGEVVLNGPGAQCRYEYHNAGANTHVIYGQDNAPTSVPAGATATVGLGYPHGNPGRERAVFEQGSARVAKFEVSGYVPAAVPGATGSGCRFMVLLSE
jgi:hypothetical protein